MGASRSKPRGDILNEFDEAYFDNLAENFNTTATSSSSSSNKTNRLFGCFSVVRKLNDVDGVEPKAHKSIIVSDVNTAPIIIPVAAAPAAVAVAPLSPIYVLPAPGPLQIHTTLKIPTPKKKSKKRRKRHHTGIGIKHVYSNPTQAPNSTAFYIHENKSSPQDNDAGDNSPFSTPEAIDIDHTLIDESSGVHTMVAEDFLSQDSSLGHAHGDVIHTTSKDHEILDASFNTGILWDSLSLNSPILVCKFSPSCSRLPMDSSSPYLYLAVGCENGAVIIAEIRDEVYRSSPEKNMDRNHSPHRSNLGSRKIRIVAKLQQDSRVRTLDFSPCGRFLLVAGDDCTVFIYSISLDIKNKSLIDGDQDPITLVAKLVEMEREDRIYSTAWSPIGNLFAVGGFDGKLAIYSFDDQQSTVRLLLEMPCNCLILSVTWSPDASALTIGGSDKLITIYEVEGIRNESDEHQVESVGLTKISEIRRMASITCLQWNFDGSYLAIATQDGSVVMFSIASDTTRLKEIYRSKDETLVGTRIHSLCFSPDGLFLAIGGCDCKCVLVEMESYTVVQEIKRGSSVKSIDWVYWPFTLDSGPSKCILAVGTEDATVALLKTGTDDDGSTQCSFDSSDYDSTDGSSIASSLSSKTTDWIFDESSFIDAKPEEEMMNVASEASDSISFVTFSSIDTSTKNSCFLAVAYGDGRLRLVSTDDWKVTKTLTFPNPLKRILWSKDGELIAIHMMNEISLVSARTWEKVYEFRRASEVMSCCWNPASDRLLIGSGDGIVTILGKKEDKFGEILGELDGNDSSVHSLDWSNDDKYIAICREDATVTIYNASDICENFFFTQSVPMSFTLESPARFVQFTSDSEIFVVAARTICLYSIVDEGTPLRELEYISPSSCFSFSSRDNLVIAGGGTKASNVMTVHQCLNSEQPVNVEMATEQCDTVTSVSFSADGALMAAAGNDGVITIFECEQWTAILCLPVLNVTD